MPRASRPADQHSRASDLCSNYLTQNFWQMCKDLKRPLECPICMTDLINPNLEEMPCGYALRICGHSTCLKCYVSQLSLLGSREGAVTCPICRS